MSDTARSDLENNEMCPNPDDERGKLALLWDRIRSRFSSLSRAQRIFALSAPIVAAVIGKLLQSWLFPAPMPEHVDISGIQYMGSTTFAEFCDSSPRQFRACDGTPGANGPVSAEGSQFIFNVATEGLKGDEIRFLGTLFRLPREPVAGYSAFEIWPDGIFVASTDGTDGLSGDIWIRNPPQSGDYVLYVYSLKANGQRYDGEFSPEFTVSGTAPKIGD